MLYPLLTRTGANQNSHVSRQFYVGAWGFVCETECPVLDLQSQGDDAWVRLGLR